MLEKGLLDKVMTKNQQNIALIALGHFGHILIQKISMKLYAQRLEC